MVKNLIFDVGMYDGTDTLHYLKKGYSVVAIEADPTLVAKATKRFRKYIDDKKLTIVNCGIAEKDGAADFYINEVRPWWNSFDRDISSRDGLPYHSIKVQCRDFNGILAEFGVPYYLKIDIEGHDKYCIYALDSNDLPLYISCEVDNHGDSELFSILYEKGYRKFKLINQNTFEPVSIPYQSVRDYHSLSDKDRLFLKVMYGKSLVWKGIRQLNGRKVFSIILDPPKNLTFQVGSSGPFGEELGGQWDSYESILQLFRSSYEDFERTTINKSYGYWADLHASL